MEEITEEMLNPRWAKAVRDHMNKANALYKSKDNPFFPCPIMADDGLILVLHAEHRERKGLLSFAGRADEWAAGAGPFLSHLSPANRAVITVGIPVPDRFYAENTAVLNKLLSRGAFFDLHLKLSHLFFKLGVLFLQAHQFLFNKRYQVAQNKGLVRHAVLRQPPE